MKKELQNIKLVINQEKLDTIRKDMIDQLHSQDKFESQYMDLVEDYVYYVALKDTFQKDIKENGIRYKKTTGNGFQVDKDNESIRYLMNTTNAMLKILNDLNLEEPEVDEEVDFSEFY